jgi:hypothetical protein
MRAKKPILLYCADLHLLSATAYALRLHPYDVSAYCNNVDVAALVADDHNTAFACPSSFTRSKAILPDG